MTMNLYVDTTAGALVLSPTNALRCLPPALRAGDKIPIVAAFLQRNPQPLNTGVPVFNYLDFSSSAVVLTIGAPPCDQLGGTFTLTFGSDTTPALAADISQYELSVALNALAYVISAGGVIVTGNIGGPFTIAFIGNGIQSAFTATSAALAPAASISIATSIAGTVNNPAVQVITFVPAPIAQVTSWTAQPSPAITVTQLQGNVIQRVAIPAGTYGGTFTLTYNGNTTTAIPFAAQMDVVAAALNALAGITGATVWPGQNYWDITIPGAAYILTGSAAGLLCPLFLTGTLDLTPQSVANVADRNGYLRGLPFLIQTTASSQTLTVYSGRL